MPLYPSVPDPAIAPSEGVRPFLKWAGGKRQILPVLRQHLPRRFGTYYEPFLGGGALFFATGPKRAVLSDVNARLVRAYRGVRDHVDKVIRLLQQYPHDRAFFDAMREVAIDSRSDPEVAAWMIYLNRTAYNGLYRVNRDNRFNVPFGRYKNPRICNPDVLHACSSALAKVEIAENDFEAAVAKAKRGDFVYFDPPYVPLSRTSSFTSYTSRGFGDAEHERLRDVAAKLKRRGVSVLLSNSSADLIQRFYGDGFELTEVFVSRPVNSRASARGAVRELIIR
jgi:DNA adenine methylase